MVQPFRLLIVEDDEDILLSFNEFFSALPQYEVETATNGLDALKILKQGSKDFHALITDLVMPNISGVGLITITRKLSPDTRIIAITGWGDHPGALASEAAADMVLNKPIDLFEIERFLMKLLTNPKSTRQDEK
ncbi:response regulator family protein [Desulforapulum autotrophicum HRM2]|uniref:Response regulator family protein n=1 Tax=Desulforapulum autotrophicum (strain ATCC 43914 / DSM 3382 / VKM B-1955 / HRM2) TaxID=177437 RepID=C0QGV5_DESAH|nr:response regulator [Desulforapulum autotrophicum]ACN15604.1 response regulator family protein [Desulforapulum autotrophicum HRM2]